ncbi:Vegetative incompatibility protein HET-E-1 [Colletotrichum siamense]|nr:Vegetative incompatibility protein HET-E-1 [Colletotrichum siamense]
MARFTKKPDREYDVVLLGATGFTGRFAAMHLAEIDRDLKWAIAGRSGAKLTKLAEELRLKTSQNPDVIPVEFTTQSLDALAMQTRCLVATVGPFPQHGVLVFKSCAENGTHYVDINGETPSVLEMIKAYEDTAKSTGAMMIPSCGVGSLPADLLTCLMVEKVKETFDCPTSAAAALHQWSTSMMKLIDVRTLKIEEVFDEEIPNYVILSHTWDEEEVSFQDFQDIDVAQNMKGFEKIEEICRLARARGVDYAWVDTCCIDKTSSADLSESINSMFRYYHDAQACYAYLADMPRTRSLEKHLRNCRWFTRGWTLQELLAPAEVRFYDQDWNLLGTKESLVEIISDITGILCDVLLGKTPLWDIPVATRMAWAATRSTRRKEDVAYSLLGIFDINMPMLYGEALIHYS